MDKGTRKPRTLAELRESLGLTGREVASRMGTHPPDVTNAEKGKLQVSPAWLVRYAKASRTDLPTVHALYWAGVERHAVALTAFARRERARLRRRARAGEDRALTT